MIRLATTPLLLLLLTPFLLAAQPSDPIPDMRLRQHERQAADAQRRRAETDRNLQQLEFRQERERWRAEDRSRRWTEPRDRYRMPPFPHHLDSPNPLYPENLSALRAILLEDIRLAEQLFPGSTDPKTLLGAKRIEIEKQLQETNSDLAESLTLTLLTTILADRELRTETEKNRQKETLVASQARAEKRYPHITDPHSPESARIREIEKEWKETNNPILHSPEKPFILAALAEADEPEKTTTKQTEPPNKPSNP